MNELIEKAKEYYKTRITGAPSVVRIDGFIDGYQHAAAERDAEIVELKELLQAWQGWFNGPYTEGVSYIDPPLTKTREALNG